MEGYERTVNRRVGKKMIFSTFMLHFDSPSRAFGYSFRCSVITIPKKNHFWIRITLKVQ